MRSLILFDCDGTLTDSNGLIVRAIQAAFSEQHLSMPSAEEVLASLGMSLHGVLDALLQQHDAQHADMDALAASYRQHYCLGESEMALYPQVLETLQTLHERGYWMGIVTGKSKAGLLRVLERFPLRDYIMVWRTADCCPSKPHPAMAEECMQELGVSPERTALVGDAHFDIRMAKHAGIRALGVALNADSGAHLLNEGAEAVVHQFDDLLAYFPAVQV